MKTFQLSEVDCPQVVFECGGHKLESEVIKNVKENPNFVKPVFYFDIVIELSPSIYQKKLILNVYLI
jgi:hypothetical protein